MNKRDLKEQLINFAVLIVEITQTMPATRAGNHLLKKMMTIMMLMKTWNDFQNQKSLILVLKAV